MIRDAIASLAVGAFVFLFLCSLAFAHVDCDMVRAKVKEHGIVVVIAWAVANGYSAKDISRIRKQCGV